MRFTAQPVLVILFATLLPACQPLKKSTTKNSNSIEMTRISKQDTLLKDLFSRYPAFFDSIVKNKEEWNVQVIYTQIDRDSKNNPHFTDHFFNLINEKYFYPASTVKLPVAVLALQKLRELDIPGLDMHTTMITFSNSETQTEVFNDPTAPDGRPSIAHYIKKILLVSDNDAFNRLYEFLGQEYINRALRQMGYDETQIIHRLSISLPDHENRHTNPVRFIDTAGNIIYEKPAAKSWLEYSNHNLNPESFRVGRGYYSGGKLMDEPFNFTEKNRISLQSLHAILQSIIFPEITEKIKRFNLKEEDYDFLREYMSMRPGESIWPVYDTAVYYDNYVKMIFYGAEKTVPEPGIRIFNKTGTAYGYLTDIAYFTDFNNHVEFLVSATIYCNSNGILNDDTYDYKTIGHPFLKNLGRVLYEYELKRKKEYKPDLHDFRFAYPK
jgi:cell division protein FtsI/penicillin-binding protein 2